MVLLNFDQHFRVSINVLRNLLTSSIVHKAEFFEISTLQKFRENLQFCKNFAEFWRKCKEYLKIYAETKFM